MKIFLDYIRKKPSVLFYMVLAWVLFALVTTILTTYPLLSQYAFKTPQIFLQWDTWNSFLVYVYNSLEGGIINYINTFLFGFWFLCFVVYKKTHINQGLSIANNTGVKKFGTLSSVAAMLGGGCIGCGFTFLTNIFGATLGSFLVTLPLRGAEIGVVGMILLIISIMRTLKQISQFTPEMPTTPAATDPIL